MKHLLNNGAALKAALLVLLAALLPNSVLSSEVSEVSEDDFGIWYSVGAEKKLSKKWTVAAEGEFRTRNNARTADRWDLGLQAERKLTRRLKLSAGYNLIWQNTPEKITVHSSDGSYNNWRPSFWSVRHRLHADLTGSLDWGRVRLSLRERWQYTFRPKATTTRYDFDNATWEDTEVQSKAKNVLRSRIGASWNTPHCPIDPYANVELFNAWSLQKVRYTLGADYKLTRQHVLSLFYRYQQVHHSDEGQTSEHIAGLSYTFKF